MLNRANGLDTSANNAHKTVFPVFGLHIRFTDTVLYDLAINNKTLYEKC